ncbi:hypothetical protein WMY93_020571 [Mugilogobius chulae]|uniref:[Histone H3]-lysine(4) N-trimethyltransferase n=1 Tax=Mugilogobius chulae TaxID=88201 RepID=A0AAW0NE16_9GOBI
MSKPGERNRLNEDHGRKQSSSLANGMDSHSGSTEKRSHHWRSYKLIIDPALKKGSHKLYRYDGQTFSMPNPGLPPVDSVRDPRIGRLWTKYKETDLPVPKFKIDDCYIGPVPPKEVTFARLNDNIREGFLTDMCKKFGEIEEVEILYNPKNKKHLGIAKVVFESVKAAKVAVQTLHNTSVMGNIIHVELDPKGENRLRYFQLLMNGSYTPRTLPVGASDDAKEVSPRTLAEALLACEPIRRLSESSAAGGTLPPSNSTTPLSSEAGYSSLRQDTPQSQGTPHTPRQASTPFSQDSNYSSRQSTPAYQSSRAESSSSYKSRRHESKFQDAYNRRPERPQYRSNMYRSSSSEQVSYKQQQQVTPPEPPPPTPTYNYTAPTPPTPSFKSAFSPYQTPLPPAFPPAEPAFHHPVQRETAYLRPPQPPPEAPPEFVPVKDRPETPPIPEPPPEPVPQPTTPPPQTPERCPSPGSPNMDSERNSLDSRIEMLLKEKRTKLPFLAERDSDTEVRMEGSPISSSSSQLSPIPPTLAAPRAPTPLPDSDDDEPIPSTAFLLKRISSPLRDKRSKSDYKDGHYRGHTPTDKMDMGHQSSGEDMEISDDEMPSTPITGGDCAKGIVVNSAMSPMQTLGLHPSSFTHLHQSGYPIAHHHYLTDPHGVPHHMLPHMGAYTHGMMPLMQMELMNCLRWEQWSTVPMSFQMQQQVLSRMAQRGPYSSYPHYMDNAFGGPYPPLSMSESPVSGAGAHGQQWQHASVPKFNPTVPPPGYDSQKDDPHKATVDGVLLVIVKELKAIMKRDLNRKMVEVVAFRAFDEWWDKKERSAKASLTPVKGAEGKEEESKPKPKETMGSSLLENWNKGEALGYEGMGLGIGLRGAIRLPSFKVKRKGPPDAAAVNESKRARPSTPVDDGLEDETKPSDESKMDGDGTAAKRRHSRPLNWTVKEKKQTHRERRISESEAESDEEQEQDSSEASSDSSDEEGAQSVVSKTSSDSGSESSDSSEYEVSSEEEDSEEEEDRGSEMEDGSRKTSSSSSSSSSSSTSRAKEQDTSGETAALNSGSRELLAKVRPPTPTGIVEDHDQESKPKGKAEEVACTDAPLTSVESNSSAPKPLASLMHLPLPPHPSLEGRSLLHPPPASLPDLPQRPRLPTDEDIPRTPGRDLLERARSLGKSQSTDTVPITPGGDAPLTGSSLLLSSPHVPGSPFSYPAQSPVLSAGVPRTPGRDLTFTPVFPDPTALSLNRKTSSASIDDGSVFKEPPLSVLPNQTSVCDDLPSSLSLDVPVAPDAASSKKKTARVKSKKTPVLSEEEECLKLPPETGNKVEPQTVVPSEDGFLSYDDEERIVKPTRRARRGWEELLLGSLSPVTTPPRTYFKPRSDFEEMTILYDIWNEGIDEEDVRLLKITYEKMLQQDNGNDWLNDTLWVNHPNILYCCCSQRRRHERPHDGCARSEGYYKIDKKDKIKYLQSTRLQSEEVPVDTQGMSIPAQVHASTRAGSERRSEQRRLLSSFACDSDLLKFNQLKFRKKKIRFCKSHIHDWGLLLWSRSLLTKWLSNTSDKTSDREALREEGIGSSYMFRVDHDTIIDATKCGNFARFINHSCNRTVTPRSSRSSLRRRWIYSRQPINVNEEITLCRASKVAPVKGFAANRHEGSVKGFKGVQNGASVSMEDTSLQQVLKGIQNNCEGLRRMRLHC